MFFRGQREVSGESAEEEAKKRKKKLGEGAGLGHWRERRAEGAEEPASKLRSD